MSTKLFLLLETKQKWNENGQLTSLLIVYSFVVQTQIHAHVNLDQKLTFRTNTMFESLLLHNSRLNSNIQSIFIWKIWTSNMKNRLVNTGKSLVSQLFYNCNIQQASLIDIDPRLMYCNWIYRLFNNTRHNITSHRKTVK